MKLDLDRWLKESIRDKLKIKGSHDPRSNVLTLEIHWDDIYLDEFCIQLEEK